jgi:hypothetical protein
MLMYHLALQFVVMGNVRVAWRGGEYGG